MVDFIRPVIPRKPDSVITYAGTNYLTAKIIHWNRLGKYKLSKSKEIEWGCEIILGLSSIIERADQGFDDKIKSIKDILKWYRSGKGFLFDSASIRVADTWIKVYSSWIERLTEVNTEALKNYWIVRAGQEMHKFY